MQVHQDGDLLKENFFVYNYSFSKIDHPNHHFVRKDNQLLIDGLDFHTFYFETRKKKKKKMNLFFFSEKIFKK